MPSNYQTADFAFIRSSHFADAAYARSCGTNAVATQRVSSFPPFMGALLAGTNTVLSLLAVLTNKTRDNTVTRIAIDEVGFGRLKGKVPDCLSETLDVQRIDEE